MLGCKASLNKFKWLEVSGLEKPLGIIQTTGPLPPEAPVSGFLTVFPDDLPEDTVP